MKRLFAVALVLGLATSAVVLAQDSSRSSQQSTQAKSLQGTITRVDNAQQTFAVKDASGQEVTVYWNEATKMSGDLKEGASVSLQTTEKDGKTFATSVTISTKKPY